jgi:hypothetical protein
MKTEKRITPSALHAQAQELIHSRRMPSVNELLKAVSEARREYVPRILAARVESKR